MAKDREVSQRHTRSTRRRTDLPALLFDLDGTLIDSVYEHVTSWADALKSAGIVIPQWKIHRRVGMSGKSFLQELFREGVARTKKLIWMNWNRSTPPSSLEPSRI